MRVKVLFFGMLKDLAGTPSQVLDLPEGSNIAAVLERCRSEFPRLDPALSSIAVALNQHYSGPQTAVSAGDEVALLPPVSGGSPGGPVHCSIVREPIDTPKVLDAIKQGQDGAVLAFEGIVRNQTRGRKTLYLDYEAYEPMAIKEMQALADAALKQFPIREVCLVHRLGRIAIRETSVLIVVASAHRAAAFEACRWLIDTLKRTVPIWKKEYFEDGAVWADGDPFPPEIPRVVPGP